MLRSIIQTGFVVAFALSLGISKCRAQAVQLPTFQQFTASSTLTVPDRGSALLGSVSGASESRTSRGVPLLGKIPGVNRGFRNQGYGRSVGTSQLRVNATIINHDELDAAVLAAARSQRAPESLATVQTRRQANFLSDNVGRAPVRSVAEIQRARQQAPRTENVEDIRRQNQLALETRQREAWTYIEKGKAAEAEGKYGSARIFYQMASSRTSGVLKQRIVDRIAYVEALRAGPSGETTAASRVASR